MIKICGIKNIDDVTASVKCGADMIGFVFHERSKRHISLEDAVRLKKYSGGNVKIVGLFVDADDDHIAGICNELRPDFIQLHGNESPSRIVDIKNKVAVGIIKAIHVGSVEDLINLGDYRNLVDYVLLDSKLDKDRYPSFGGNGVQFDWSIVSDLNDKQSLILSGGLRSDNVARAFECTRIPNVDVSSGVEGRTGCKDYSKIESFINEFNIVKFDLI